MTRLADLQEMKSTLVRLQQPVQRRICQTAHDCTSSECCCKVLVAQSGADLSRPTQLTRCRCTAPPMQDMARLECETAMRCLTSCPLTRPLSTFTTPFLHRTDSIDSLGVVVLWLPPAAASSCTQDWYHEPRTMSTPNRLGSETLPTNEGHRSDGNVLAQQFTLLGKDVQPEVGMRVYSHGRSKETQVTARCKISSCLMASAWGSLLSNFLYPLPCDPHV